MWRNRVYPLTFTVVSDDNDDLIIQFPDWLLERMGWKAGDDLIWIENADGTYSVTRYLLDVE
jgi:bifunctional DNA-binding transcriptional regulator/antitoxin component of YhaV-PrlF toxin-antitoxin module